MGDIAVGQGILIIEEKNISVEHKPNRAERRKMQQEQARKVKHLKKKEASKKDINDKLKGLIAGIKENAVSIKDELGIDTMYFCINSKDIKDTMIINYIGNEALKDSLGIKTDITLNNGTVRKSNIVVYVEVLDDNSVNIDDGRGVYINNNT